MEDEDPDKWILSHKIHILGFNTLNLIFSTLLTKFNWQLGEESTKILLTEAAQMFTSASSNEEEVMVKDG